MREISMKINIFLNTVHNAVVIYCHADNENFRIFVSCQICGTYDVNRGAPLGEYR